MLSFRVAKPPLHGGHAYFQLLVVAPRKLMKLDAVVTRESDVKSG